MSDNERGFHHPNKVNHAAPATCDTPTPMSRNVGIGNEMGPGILGVPMNADPHARGFKMPVGEVPSAARPRNDMGPGLLPANGAINPEPHVYNPSSQVQQRNTYAAPTWESKFK
jgi:hypothetical protein